MMKLPKLPRRIPMWYDYRILETIIGDIVFK